MAKSARPAKKATKSKDDIERMVEQEIWEEGSKRKKSTRDIFSSFGLGKWFKQGKEKLTSQEKFQSQLLQDSEKLEKLKSDLLELGRQVDQAFEYKSEAKEPELIQPDQYKSDPKSGNPIHHKILRTIIDASIDGDHKDYANVEHAQKLLLELKPRLKSPDTSLIKDILKAFDEFRCAYRLLEDAVETAMSKGIWWPEKFKLKNDSKKMCLDQCLPPVLDQIKKQYGNCPKPPLKMEVGATYQQFQQAATEIEAAIKAAAKVKAAAEAKAKVAAEATVLTQPQGSHISPRPGQTVS